MMKTHIAVATLAALAAVGLAGQEARAHDPASRVEIELEGVDSVGAGRVQLTFSLIDTKKRRVLTPAELNVVHEKKLHAFAFDPALKEFRHEHPEFNGEAWVLETALAVNAKYWLWAQGQISDDGEEFAAKGRFTVTGGAPENPVPPFLGIVKSGADGNSVATLVYTRLRAGRPASISVRFSRNDGTAPERTPWLGAPAHVMAFTKDGDSMLHVHPMDHGTPNELMLHVTFKWVGEYRLWMQYIDGGTLRTVPLSVHVER